MKDRGRRVSMAAACLIVGLLALLVAASASAAWTRHVNVAKQHDVAAPAVAMDPAGDAVFMWRHDEGVDPTAIFARARDAGGTFSPIQAQAVAPPGFLGIEKDLAVDSQGNAYSIWKVSDNQGLESVRTRVRYADGTRSPVQTLRTVTSGESVGNLLVGVDASGSAVFAWHYRRDDGNMLLQARTRSASGVLSPVRTVAQNLSGGTQTTMGVDSAGDATFMWEAGDAPAQAEYTRILASDGTLSPTARISRPGYIFAGGQVAVTPAGRAVFAWNDYKDGKLTVLVRGRDADGTLEPPQVLASGDVDGTFVGGYGLAIAPDGEAVISWQSDGALRAETRAPGGTLGPVRTVTTAHIYGWDQGIDQQGNLVFAWDGPADSKSRVFVRTVDAGGALSPAKAVSPSGYWAYLGNIAVTPGGDAAVVWQEGKTGWAVQATFGP